MMCMTENNVFEEELENEGVDNPGQPLLAILLTVIAVLFSASVGGMLIYWWSGWKGFNPELAMKGLTEISGVDDRFNIRVIAGMNQLFTFLFPALIVAILVARHHWKSFLGLANIPSLKVLSWGIAFILVAYPLAQFVYWINMLIPLPGWMMEMEDSANRAIQFILLTNDPLELLQNIVLIGVLPALGEELLFRGIIQQQLTKLMKNPVMGIWVSALIFSTIHMQFQGFLPRVLLGGILGYLFYWSRSLWVPIVAHFVNNVFQVILQFFFKEEFSNMQAGEEEGIFQTPDLSVFIWVFISIFLLILIGSRLSAFRDAGSAPKNQGSINT